MRSHVVRRRAGIAALVVGAAFMLSFAGGAASGPPERVSSIVDVKLKNFVFNPATLTITAGDSVTFTNEDSACHTVTRGTPATGACAGSNSTSESDFDVALDGAGKSTTIKFTTKGSVSVYCKPHASSMRLTITVNAEGQPQPQPQKTPGFEAVALFGALGIAAVLAGVLMARRRPGLQGRP